MAHLYLVQLCRIGVIQDIDPEAEPSDRRNIDPALRLVILNVLSAFFKVSTMHQLWDVAFLQKIKNAFLQQIS